MTNLSALYSSPELFPLFSNRLLGETRPEFPHFMQWMNLDAAGAEPLDVLGRSGGLRATDSLETFPFPSRTDDGKLLTFFFSHGLSHLPKAAAERVSELRPGDKLFLLSDFQNPHDEMALAIRTDDPSSLVGYCPRYLAYDLKRLCDCQATASSTVVERINPIAPIQYRLLCRFTCKWPTTFEPFDGDMYQPIASVKHATRVVA